MSTSSRQSSKNTGITAARFAIPDATANRAVAAAFVHHTLHRISLLIGLIVLLLIVAM